MNKLSNKRINFIVINSYKNEQNSLLNLDTKANFHFCFYFVFVSLIATYFTQSPFAL